MKVYFTLSIRNPYPQPQLRSVFARLPNCRTILETDRRDSNTEWARAYWSRDIPETEFTLALLEDCAEREAEIAQLAISCLEDSDIIMLNTKIGDRCVTRVLRTKNSF